MRLSLLPTGPPPVFQHWWVRSSTACYGRFNLPMGRSPGFASIAPDMRPVQTRFPFGSPPKGLTRPDTITRRIIMQKARGQARLVRIGPPTACRHGVSGSVSSPGFFPPFGRPTGFAIGRHRVFSLAGWSPRIRAEFHVLDLTGVSARATLASSTGLSPALARRSRRFRLAAVDPLR